LSATAQDQPASLLSHLDELRWRLVRAALGIAGGAAVAFLFKNWIKATLEAPYFDACDVCSFQALAPAEQFGVLMKLVMFGGIIVGSPVVLYQIWAFISPALTDKERKWAVPIIAACSALFMGGVAFGYFTMPRAFQFLLQIFPDVENNFQLGQYFTFVTRYLLAFGISFLYPVFLFSAAAAGLITSAKLAEGRRWAVLVIVIAAAAITPSGDALTLAMLSVPLYAFYEVTYWLIRLTLRK
jgi:sec-independent protein translocase protein TatC